AVALLLPQRERLITLLRDETLRQQLVSWLDSIGPMGIPVLLVFQALQIVIAFLPGGLVELAGGMLYGPIWGLFISLSGILLGTVGAFWVSRRLGQKVVRKLVRPELFDRYANVCRSRKFEEIALLLFFLPGVPKDILVYVIGSSGALTKRFMIAATLVRIPAVIVAVLAGSAFGEGDFLRFAAIYLSFLVVGILGALIHRIILKRLVP
ncbi:MAG: VTT domain-containing protein, partial [Oscillospiraceae bacterium]